MNAVERWDEYHRAVSAIGAQMIGAANYYDKHPDEATDARLAEAFRSYVKELRGVPSPVPMERRTSGVG